MHYLKTEAIILSKKIRGEFGVVINFYTPGHGKLEGVVSGAKKISSKLNAHCEPLSLSELMLARGVSAWRVAGAVTLQNFEPVNKSFEQIFAAQYLAQLTNSLLDKEQPEKQIYFLLKKTLELLAKQVKTEKVLLLVAAYLLKLVAMLGYQPNLKTCLRCQKNLPAQKNILELLAGGFYCPTCVKLDKKVSYKRVNPAVIKVWRVLLQDDLEKALRLHLSLTQVRTIFSLITEFSQIHSQKSINFLWL
ncbi:MAG: DNA repair protein RecO [Candidatus Buchananbacteria bacterium]